MKKMWLFHQDHPKGELFKADYVAEHEQELRDSGWVDTPALLDLPPEVPELTKEQVENMAPDELVGMVKTLGFMVMTEEQFEAKVMQRLAEKEAMAAEVDAAPEQPNFGDQFDAAPESLTKDELVQWGNATYDLSLKKTMSEATLIQKIQEVRN